MSVNLIGNVGDSLLHSFSDSDFPSLDRLPAWAGPSTTFEDKAAVMKSWLNDCCTQHGKDRCRPLDFVPLRLVQVGLDGATVQLVKGEAIGSLASVNYTTLSYCWGKTHQLQTTQDNVTEFSTEIPRELLPKTMREAIRMTHLLGIPYIWIDALCIVQDDREEWQNQAAQMHNIFRGSQLTIAAGQSSDSSKGCFPTRECLPGTGFVSNIEAADEVKARAGRLFRLYNGDVRNKAINSNILSTRGWTLQEQLLSTRIATYSEPHLLWHCHSCFATESGLVLDPDFIQSSAISFLYQDILQDERLRQFTWRQIVENYTLREFTHPSDRIPAIAGLIQYFSSLFQDNPVLGLWPKTFARDLGWMRLTEANDVSKVTGLPSWTWLASRGGVKYSFWPWNSAAEQQQVSHTNLLDYSV